MKKCFVILMIAVLSVWNLAGMARAEAFEVDAPAAMLIDNATGKVLYEKNADEKRPFASVTKIMTLCLIFEQIDSGRLQMTDKVTMSENATKIGGSHVFSDAGYEYEAQELIKSIIIASANDASIAMAEHIAGTEEVFVGRMNEKAKQWGMVNTHFSNCTGMPTENHYSTARDITIMSRELVKHEEFFRWSGTWMDEIVHRNGRVTGLTNTNRLVRFYTGCDGLKTGSASDAKYCISASATKNGMRLIAVVLGAETSDDRFAEAKKMLNYGFANYRSQSVVTKGGTVENTVKVVGGKGKTVKTVAESDFSTVTAQDDEAEIVKSIQLPESIKAPIQKGEVLGQMLFTKGGAEIGKVNIVAAEDVLKAGYGDYFKCIIRAWLGRAA